MFCSESQSLRLLCFFWSPIPNKPVLWEFRFLQVEVTEEFSHPSQFVKFAFLHILGEDDIQL